VKFLRTLGLGRSRAPEDDSDYFVSALVVVAYGSLALVFVLVLVLLVVLLGVLLVGRREAPSLAHRPAFFERVITVPLQRASCLEQVGGVLVLAGDL
jgi:hypothetical protein